MAAFTSPTAALLTGNSIQPSSSIPVTTETVQTAVDINTPRVIQVGHVDIPYTMDSSKILGVSHGYGSPQYVSDGSAAPLLIWWHDPADYPTIGSYVPKFAMRVRYTTNDVALNGTVSCKLYTVSPGTSGDAATGGAAGVKTYTFTQSGTWDAIPLSSPEYESNTWSEAVSLNEDWYGIGITVAPNGVEPTFATNSHVHATVEVILTYAVPAVPMIPR